MGGFLVRIKTWWQSADRTQKLITICGGGFLAVLLFGTYIFASKPKMSLVFSNLDPADSGTVAMEVENMGIAVEYDQNGNVKVPSDKVAQVKANLAMKGKLPKGGMSITKDLDNMPFITDPKVQAERLKAVEESELSQSIQFFDGVDSANVQVTPAIDSPFDSEKKPAQANVTVAEKSGSLISQEEARAMANLVASAIPGLDKSKVTIFTRTGRALWDGQDMMSPNSVSTNKLDLEKTEGRKRRDEIQEALNRMLGPGNAIAMVDVTLNLDSSTERSSTTTPTKPINEKRIEEEMKAKGSAGTLQSGSDSNIPGANPIASTGDGGNSAYTASQTTREMGTSTLETETTRVPGNLQAMAITVLVNKTEKMTPEAIKPIEDLASSYLGPHVGDKSFTAKVVAYPFDTTQAEAAKKAQAAEASSSRTQQILSFLPIAALLIVAFLVVRSIGKIVPKPYAPVLAMAGGPALPMSGPEGAQALLPSHRSKALDAANQLVLPEIVKQKALEAGISEEQLQAAIEEAGEAGISIEDIPSIKDKINVPLEQIKKMATERPESVAMLIKSWLIEEGIRR